MKNNLTHKYIWYIPENNDFIYDDDVVRYITPRLKMANTALESIRSLINEITLTDNLVNNYLEISEALSEIDDEIKTLENYL